MRPHGLTYETHCNKDDPMVYFRLPRPVQDLVEAANAAGREEAYWSNTGEAVARAFQKMQLDRLSPRTMLQHDRIDVYDLPGLGDQYQLRAHGLVPDR